jgi:hypothetical protein
MSVFSSKLQEVINIALHNGFCVFAVEVIRVSPVYRKV